jgi:hypothetical protein
MRERERSRARASVYMFFLVRARARCVCVCVCVACVLCVCVCLYVFVSDFGTANEKTQRRQLTTTDLKRCPCYSVAYAHRGGHCYLVNVHADL